MPLLLLLTLLCLAFYLAFVLRAGWHFARIERSAQRQTPKPYISVVIPARNEAANLLDCLQSVLQQDYPQEYFEVILINDHSTDNTASIARSLQGAYPQLSVWDLPSGQRNAYKKAALSYAIERAQGEIILQTDADCIVSPQWLSTIAAYFDADTMLVSGPVQLTYQNHSLQRLQSLESMGLVVLGAGSLVAGTPNMANGANLAYRKKAFLAVGGFQDVDGVASGDDEFLLHKIHQAFPTQLKFAKAKEAIVQTPSQPHWQALKAQRLRWVSKARSYQNRWVNVVQLLSYLGFWSFPLLLLYGFWQPLSWGIFLLAFVSKSLIDFYLMRQAAAFFHNLPLLRSLFLLECLYIPYVLWIGLAGNLVSRYEWKGRSVK
ncbi:MAG: glycosyltransferase [Bacteroidota bacterium]